MTTQELVDQIEGEASIFFDIKDEKVIFSTLSFPHFRGMEMILKGKHALDALVITPRVCGICGHAHLMASVRAIEDAYKNANEEIQLNTKIEIIREFTLSMEVIQNHFKWIYLTLFPEFAKISSTQLEQTPLKGAYGASIATKAIATFGGQWPHSSYMVPGGITSDPTQMDILKAQTYVDELIAFFEKETLGTTIETFLAFKSCKEFENLNSDVSVIEENLVAHSMNTKGFAYDNFLVLGKHKFTKESRLKQTRAYGVDLKYVTTTPAYSPKQKSYALNALYRDSYYETGPLARMMAIGLPIVKNMHRRFKDSAYSRVMARVFELAYLLKQVSSELKNIDISQTSCNTPINIKNITAFGIGVVEAPRGPLIHKVNIEKGIIKNYEIITPTQFNIGSDKKTKPTSAQKAMMDVSKDEALFIFRTFDVCSVCTTH